MRLDPQVGARTEEYLTYPSTLHRMSVTGACNSRDGLPPTRGLGAGHAFLGPPITSAPVADRCQGVPCLPWWSTWWSRDYFGLDGPGATWSAGDVATR